MGTTPVEARHNRLTGDGFVSREPVLLSGVHLVVASDGDYVDLYDGQDDSGRHIVRLVGGTNQFNTASFTPPVRVVRGLYAKFSATDSALTVCFCPVRDAPTNEA
jgi:hypothetical protein